MRFLSTRTHGIADYIIGILLILAPFVLGFDRGGAETWVPVVVGAGLLVVSLFTRYEMGLVHSIPMSAHLGVDLVGGILLAVSPWLFGFADFVWVPHLVVGLLEIGAALITRTEPAWVPGTPHI